MGLTFKRLHPHFVGEASPIELRRVHDPETLAAIRAGMDEYAVCVFRDQAFTDDEHLGFAQRLDGALHTKLGSAAIQKRSEEHTSELQSLAYLVCRLLLEKK